MHIDLIELIKDALSPAKNAEDIVQTLDPHAPVELHFGSTPMVRVSQISEGEVQLLSRLSDQVGLPASSNAVAVIEQISAPAPWAHNECLSLMDIDGQLHLHAIVARPYLANGDVFSISLAGFYDRLFDVYQALKG